jgi:hypothetical protein
MKFFIKKTLIEAARAGNERGYNRQLDPEALQEGLEANANWFFPITFALPHEHIAGEQVEPHLRVQVLLDTDPDTTVLLDISQQRYNKLPDHENLPQNGLTGPVEGSRRTGGKGGLSIVR